MEEPIIINRGAIMIVPKKPFYDWANSFDSDFIFDQKNDFDHNVYLIKDDFVIDHIDNVVKKHWKVIFENELMGQWLDEGRWPQKRTFKMFNEWFDFYISSMAYDLLEKPIIREQF